MTLDHGAWSESFNVQTLQTAAETLPIAMPFRLIGAE